MRPRDGYHYALTYKLRRLRRQIRWAIARRVLREELEAFADPMYASPEAKVGGDLSLARQIITGNAHATDHHDDVALDVDFLFAKHHRNEVSG